MKWIYDPHALDEEEAGALGCNAYCFWKSCNDKGYCKEYDCTIFGCNIVI